MPRFGAILVLAFAAVSAAAAGETMSARELQSASRYCSQGLHALAIGDIKKASAHYAKALAVAPHFPDALLGTGHVAMREGRYEAALTSYRSARDVFSLLGESIFDLQVRRYGEAQHELITLRSSLQYWQGQLLMVERSPGASEGASAQIQRQIAQLQDAVHNLEAVQMPAHTDTKQAPGEIDFYIGNALFRLDRPDEALASWESCATKSPNFALVKINLAVAYWKKGRFDEAKSLLAAAEAQGFPVNPHMKADLESAAAGAAPAPSPPPAPPGPSTTPPAPAPPSSSSPAAPSTPSPPSADGGA